MRVRSCCPTSSELLEGLSQCCHSWGIPKLPHEHGKHPEPTGVLFSSLQCNQCCNLSHSHQHRHNQSGPPLSSFPAFLTFLKTLLFIRNTWYKTQEAAIHIPGQNDSSSILDGTSVTSDTQPAGLLCFLPQFWVFFQSISSLLPLKFGERLL